MLSKPLKILKTSIISRSLLVSSDVTRQASVRYQCVALFCTFFNRSLSFM